MKFEKIHNKGQAQLFHNSYLEMLTKTHPLVIWGMYSPVFAGLPFYSFSKLREMLTLNPAEDAGLLIARLLMERESQKMQARRSFKPNDDIPDDEKW